MGSFSATVRGWSEKGKRNADLVARESIQDIGELMTRPVDGVTRGAPFVVGKVPVDTGELIGSVIVQLNGSTIARGGLGVPPDFTASLAGFDLGDTVTGAFTAPYARIVEYKQGRYMVRNAVQNWQAVVNANAALFRD